MKKKIHPKFNNKIKVTCSCGNTFFTGSTEEEIETELCSKCHPFFTGKQRIVDTENLVAKFEKRKEVAKKTSYKSKREKMKARKSKKKNQKRDAEKAPTLKDMLKKLQ